MTHENSNKNHISSDQDSPISSIQSILGKRVLDSLSPNGYPSDCEEEGTSKKPSKSSTRCKGADLPQGLQRLSKYVIADYKAVLATRCPFPDSDEEQTIAGAAIIRGTKLLKVDIETASHLDMLINVITIRDSQFRGDLRTKVIPSVIHYYGFNKAVSNKVTYMNQKLHAQLKYEDAFLFKHPAKLTGLYEHPILQAAINDVWFKDRHAIGIRFETYFSPIPLVTMAIVFTAIEYVIDCWATGIFNTEKQFTAKEYHEVYNKHITSLGKAYKYSDNTKRRLRNICRDLIKKAKLHAGVKASSEFKILDDCHFAAFDQASSSSDESEEEDNSDKGSDDNDAEVPAATTSKRSDWPPLHKRRRVESTGPECQGNDIVTANE